MRQRSQPATVRGGFLIPGTGIHMNNMLERKTSIRVDSTWFRPESLPSMMCPMLITGDEGKASVLGRAVRTESERLFQTAYRMMFRGMDLEKAVLAPECM